MSLEFSLKKKMTPNPVGRVLPSSLNETAGRATEGGTVTRKPTALLNKYLSGVLAQMERHPRNEWGGIAYEAAAGVDQALFSMADIRDKSKELKKEEKKFDFSSKAAYFLNAQEKKGRAGLVGAFTLAVASSAALMAGDTHTACALCMASFSYPSVRRYANTSFLPKTHDGKKKLQDYNELKKAQIALKVLKKVYRETDQAFHNDPAGLFAVRNRPGARD